MPRRFVEFEAELNPLEIRGGQVLHLLPIPVEAGPDLFLEPLAVGVNGISALGRGLGVSGGGRNEKGHGKQGSKLGATHTV